MGTVNQTREYLSSQKNFYAPEVRKVLINGLDTLLVKHPDIEGFRTVVIFYWKGHLLSFESAKTILLGVQSIPEGLSMKINVCSGSFH